jgi:hypothetical protein
VNITVQRLGTRTREIAYSQNEIALARILQGAATRNAVRRPSAIYLAQAHELYTNPRLTELLKEYLA